MKVPKLSKAGRLAGLKAVLKDKAPKTITVQVTAAKYKRLEKGLQAAQKDVPALTTVNDLVQFWIDAELSGLPD